MNQIQIFFQMCGLDLCHQPHKGRRGGGVGIFIKQGIKYKVIEKLSAAVEDHFECISVELSLDRKVIVSCVYGQPGSSIEEFTNCIDNMFNTQYCSLYMCGDFNINLLNYDNHSGGKFFV